MNDQTIIDFLRSRGQAEPPVGFVRSVMAAVDAAPIQPSRFSGYLPAFAGLGAVAAVAVLALILSPGRDLGHAPRPSGTPAAATFEELEAAVLSAVDRLVAGEGVHGRQTYSIEGYLASATWFDWRPNGDQVVVERQDIDVSAPWWTDPDGRPVSVGERIQTTISVVAEGRWYVAREEGWIAPLDAPRWPLTWGIGILSGAIPPVGPLAPNADAVVTRSRAVDGSEIWTVDVDDGARTWEWRIGPDGALAGYTVEGFDLPIAPELDLGTASERVAIEFMPVEDPPPVPTPDLDAPPDPAAFGLPADFPLEPR